MKDSRLRGLIWPISILIIAAIAVGSWYILSRTPLTKSLFPLNESRSAINILSPEDQSAFPADAAIPILISTTTDEPLAAVQLWVNGELVTESQAKERTAGHHVQQIYWTPLTTGTQRLLVRSTTVAGQTTTSNPISVQISAPAGARLVSTAVNGDPISELNIPLGGNPDLLPSQTDPPQIPLENLPQAAFLKMNPSLWLRGQLNLNPSPPQAPALTYYLNQCQGTLVVRDKADNELGFFIYRSTPGSSTFQRIAALENSTQNESFTFSVPDSTPGTIYYASAFNAGGETPSSPVMISDFDSSCSSPLIPGLPGGPDQEDLQFLDLAYFYYAFDGDGFRRYPLNPEDFLTPSEYPTSLGALIDKLAEDSPQISREAEVVLWGWSGGNLVNLGAYHLEVDSSRLLVCNLGTGCTGDVASGFRSTYGELANDAEDQIREFYWSSSAPGATAVLWQISTSPFPESFSPHPQGLVAAGCGPGAQGGSFLVDFKDLDAYLPAPSSCGPAAQPWIEFSRFSLEPALWPDLETHYFIRFTPMAGNLPAGKPSNTVEILSKPGETHLEPVIVDHLPEIYQVEILNFSPVKNMDFRYWGCVSITGLDYDEIWNYYRSTYPATIPDSSIDQMANQVYNDLNYAVQNNLIICPAPYEKSSDSGSVIAEWGSMLLESLEELWESIVTAFNDLKNEVVDQVATGINKLGIPCDSECKAGLKAGLEIGITYFTGIPPNLPSFEQLKEHGIEYAIEMAAAEAGIPCPEQCQQVLREGVEDVVNASAQINSQPGCVNENWANVLGKHSLCLPPGVETEAVPEGVSEPARAAVKITRTGQEPPGHYQYHGQPAYTVNVRFTSENTKLSGTSIPYTYSYLDWDKGYKDFFTVNAPVSKLQNDVFDSQTLPIPPLAPGESITIPLSLTPHTYYIPEHLHSLMIELNSRELEIEDVGGVGGSRGTFFDWLCLYRGGLIKIEASVSCLSVPGGLIGSTSPSEDSELVPCGPPAEPVFYQETNDACYP